MYGRGDHGIPTEIVKPPPPPRPQVPVAVPDDVVLDEEILDINPPIDIDQPLDVPTEPPPAEDKVIEEFWILEEQPELIGGIAELQKKVVYPRLAVRAGIEGTITLQFVVDEEGNVVDPVVLRGIGGGCDEEALAAIKRARFKPGKQRGRPVKVKYWLPIIFRLK